MEKLNENRISPLVNRGDFTRGLPFYGPQGDFNFTMGRSQFTPGVSIKQTPLTDLSIKGDSGFTDFDNSLSQIKRYFKPGDRIRGIIINSQLDSENGRIAVGKLYKILPDYSNNSIKVLIKNPKTLELHEVYPESIERIYESQNHRALSFTQFINS